MTGASTAMSRASCLRRGESGVRRAQLGRAYWRRREGPRCSFSPGVKVPRSI